MKKVQEEKMDIFDIHVDNKSKFLTIAHNMTVITNNAKTLAIPGAIYPGTQPVHKDLLDVFQLMVPHMVMLIEVPGFKSPKPNYLTDKLALSDEKLNGYYVNGLSISDKGVISIKGGIRAENGKCCPLNAHTFSDPDTCSYPYLDNLLALVEEAKEEAMSYYIDGKFGEGAQPELFDAEKQEAKQGE